MNVFKKHLSIIMVFLAGILITAHEVIPHHHHFDSVYSHSNEPENHCSESGNDKNHDGPLHCHAFNEIFLDRLDNESIDQEIYLPIDYLCIFNFDLDDDTRAYYKKSKFIPSRQSNPKESYFQTDSPLRAPPSLI